MHIISFISVVITASVVIAYFNERYLKLQATIAIMMASLLISSFLIFASNHGLFAPTQAWLQSIGEMDFADILLNGLLGVLLFAGSLNLNFNEFHQAKRDITLLAFGSTILSTMLVSLALHFLTDFAHLHWGFPDLPWITCLLFGALISPTDPIAVLATLKTLGAPKSLSVRLAGESLFNDGIGVVIFLTLFEIATSKHMTLSWVSVITTFLHECFGGIAYGVAIGYGAYRLIKTIDDPELIVLITLAVATGGYTFANSIHVSGPLAMVVAGMFLGNKGQNFNMPERTVKSLQFFWHILDEILNILLFFIMGLELILIDFSHDTLILMALTVPLVLALRYLTVLLPIHFFSRVKNKAKLIRLLSWGGLRGGLAIALVLTIPEQVPGRDLIFALTYAVVVFSIVIQGSTVPLLLKDHLTSKS